MNRTDIEVSVSPARITKGLWWDRAWSLVQGCTPVSEGCAHCWSAAETHMRAKQKNPKIRARYEGLTDAKGRWLGHIRLAGTDVLAKPLHVRTPKVWAVWNDLFHPDVPDEFVDRILAACALAPMQMIIVLTKRPERMQAYLSNKDRLLDGIWHAFADDHVGPTISTADDVRKWCKKKGMSGRERDRRMGIIQNAGGFWFGRPDLTPNAFWPLPNVFLGTSAEDQPAADARLPYLMKLAAAGWRTFVSIEPMRGPVDIYPWLCSARRQQRALGAPDSSLPGYCHSPCDPCEDFDHCKDLQGVILGGQTGAGAPPMDPDWVRKVRDQCAEAGVPFFMKQMARREPIPPDLMIRELPWLAK